MANVGYATLQVIPSFQGAQSAITQGLTGAGSGAEGAGAAVGGMFGKGLGAVASVAAPAAVAGAVVAIGKELYDLGSKFDEVYDGIRVKTGATGKELEGLKADFKGVVQTVPTDFASAGEAVGTLNQRLGLTGEPLQRLSTQFLEVSRITGTDLNTNLKAGADALTNFGITGKDQGVAMDQLYRASQQSGVGFSDLAASVASNGVVLRASGLTFAESTAFLASLGKAGVDASDAMPGLSKALGQAAEAGVSAKDFMAGFYDQIKNAATPTEAAAIAVETLGKKAGPKFAQLIQEGKLSYEDMLGAITNGKDSILKAGADTQDFGEKWTILKNQVFVALEPVATKLFNAISQGMTWITEHREDIAAVFRDIGDAIKKAWIVAEPIYKALFGQIKAWFKIIDDLIHGRWGEIWGDLVGIVKAALNLLIAPLKGLVHLFGWENIKQAVSDGINAVVGFFVGLPGRILEAIGDLLGLLVQKGIDLIQGLVNGYMSIIGNVTTFFANLAMDIFNWVADTLGTLVSRGVDLITGLITGYLSIIGQVTTFFANLAMDIFNWVADTLGTLVSRGADLITGLINGYMSIIGNVTSFFANLASDIFNWVADTLGTLVSRGVDLLQGFINGYVSLVGDVMTFFTSLPLKILDWLGDMGEWLLQAGKDLLHGLWKGIEAAKDWLFGKIKDLAGKIKSAFTDPLGIFSPSRVMMEVGHNITQGLAIGIDRGGRDVFSAMSGVAAGVQARTPDPYRGSIYDKAGGGGPMVGQLHVHGVSNPEVTADMVNRRLARAVRRR